MEYCEGFILQLNILEGDLSFHVKRKCKQSGGELFPEKVIINWFIQCAMALNFIHQNRILHRDIKSSNIFITSNGYVKIGDFGISKVLEHTYDSA
jgi:NIMA (never in mitosis gene a)-related kinase